MTPADRAYGGRSAAERRDERRTRLLDAALELFGTAGYRATSQQAVARDAGLSPRYFYESFPDKEALLVAVYERHVATVTEAVLGALTAAGPGAPWPAVARAGMHAYVGAVLRDPRGARVQLLEVVGVSDALEQRRRAVIHAFAGLITERLRPLARPGGLRPDVVALGLAGAVNECLIDHVVGGLDLPRADLEEHLAAVVASGGDLVAAPPGA